MRIPDIKTFSAALLTAALWAGFANPVQAALDLDSWNSLLGSAVVDGRVNYGQWRDNPDFDELVEQVATADTSAMNRQEQLVFYINAYNILAARGILDGSSPSSLLGRWVYFQRDKYDVAGQRITLYDLEHDLIIPLAEPRIHFAIVCASESCPVLRSEAYRLETLDDQLDDAARGFINDDEKNRFDIGKGEAGLSSIFKWFTEDFERDGRSLQQYIGDYVSDEAVAARLREDGFKVEFLKYDWSLNGTLE